MIDRRTIVAVLLLVLGAGVLAVLSPSIVTTADISLTELYTELASHARLLMGPYSRFGWHHPGPLYFYLLSPLYVLSGRSGAALYIGAALINVIAVAVLLKTVYMEHRHLAAAAIACACLIVAARVDGLIASPWTAHIVAFPVLAFLAVCAAIAAGRTRLLPAAALAASFVAQTDLALVPTVAGVTLLTLVAIVWRAARTGPVPHRDLTVAGVMALIVWAPTIVEATSHHGGNLAALWRFFLGASGSAHTLQDAVGGWACGLVGLVRPGLRPPWGRLLDLASITWEKPAALALLVGLVVCVGVAARRRQRFDAWLGAMILGAAVSSLWALTRARGDLLDHEVFWLTPIGAVAAAVVLASIASVILPRVSTHPPLARYGAGVPTIILIILCGLGIRQAEGAIGLAQRLADSRDVLGAVDAIETHFDRQHSRAAVIEVVTAWGQATPIILRLRQHHRRVAVAPGNLFMFTDALAPTGREDEWLKIQPGRRPVTDSGAMLIFDSFNVGVVAEPVRYPGSR